MLGVLPGDQDLVCGSARDVECHLTVGRYGPGEWVGMRSCRGACLIRYIEYVLSSVSILRAGCLI